MPKQRKTVQPFMVTLHLKKMKNILLGLTVFLTFTIAQSQTKKVLFLGNSYTYVNNLPQMIADAATSMGDIFIYDSNTPGGYYLGQHATDSISLNKIKVGNWDYVVLQDQSMSYAYPPPYFYQMPSAYKLDSVIKAFNNCGQTIFYITWGRKNGDTYLCTPPACVANTWITRTYYQMDSTIQLNYMFVADSLKAIVSPVGAVWRYIRRKYPTIELFQPDESHPSQAGTYAAACCFYTILFRKDPTLISFNSGLAATDAADIRNAIKVVVYDSLLNWNIGEYDSLLNVACNTSVQNISNNSVLKNFPNPFSTQTTLRTNTLLHNATLTLINSFGQIVKQIENISGQTITLFRDNLPSGIYFLRLTENNKTLAAEKLVILNN
jgi:hypothetical protein